MLQVLMVHWVQDQLFLTKLAGPTIEKLLKLTKICDQ